MGVLRSVEKNEEKKQKIFEKKNNKKSLKIEKQEKVEENYNYYTTSMGVHMNVDWKKKFENKWNETKLKN